MHQFDQKSTTNILLSRMRPEDAALLAPHVERVPLGLRHYLTQADKEIESVYFPEDGVASIVSNLPDTGPTEVGIFGRDGMSGTAILLGSKTSPHDTFMQIEGHSGWRISSEKLLKTTRQSPELLALLLRFVQSQVVQSAHSAVSNAHHRVEARLARWLLMCHDRIDGDDVHITHEFMSMMIAAQRSGVTLTLHELEGQGMIRSRRGVVTIVDRDMLERHAGDAYGRPEAEYARLIAPMDGHHEVVSIKEMSNRNQ